MDKLIILKETKQYLQRVLADNIKDVILFGSQVTDKANSYSDYDILVILKQKPDWHIERKISDIIYEIDLKYNIITDTHIISEPELNELRGKQPIFLNALQKGIHA